MVTDTEQREREISQVAEASSRLGEIEGQLKLLVRRTEENARNARDDYRALDAKIDRNFNELNGKIDSTAIVLDGKIDRTAKDLGDKIDSTAIVLDGKIDRNFQELNGKIDRSVKDLTDKIDQTAKDLGDKIDQTAADIRADMRADTRETRAEIRRLLFWMLGIGGTLGAVMVAGIVVFIVERLIS